MKSFYVAKHQEEWVVKASYVPVMFCCETEEDAEDLCSSLNDNQRMASSCTNLKLTSPEAMCGLN